MQSWQIFELPKITDVRGNITVIEGGAHIPFEIARAYYIYDVPSGSTRAGHAHRELRQLFLALSGSFSLHLEDGIRKETFLLNRPHTGVLVEPGVWREIDNFSGGAVCMVLASLRYDEADYIRSYEDFQTYAACNNQAPARGSRLSVA
jgi:dTDP-4-dehydrorhamnose 3,5-epimerase-like enzyme